MNRSQFVSLTAAGVASTVTGSGATEDAAGGRSLWVWLTPLSDAAAVVRFAKTYGFGLIFYSVPRDERSGLKTGDATLLDALAAFRRENIAVYGVAGDPSWVKRNRTEPPQAVRTLLDARNHGIFLSAG